eukprot:60149-Chlamydomonas_euryale.AAC.1
MHPQASAGLRSVEYSPQRSLALQNPQSHTLVCHRRQPGKGERAGAGRAERGGDHKGGITCTEEHLTSAHAPDKRART